MKLHICSVVLWSRNPDLEPRIMYFEPGMVNVLTGNARTGKSAVIPIIDYCLCSGQCAIPRKVVRAACEWFGVVVELAEGEMLLARRNPGEREASDEMYVRIEPEIKIPRFIEEPNERADRVKRMLDKMAGLSHLDFAAGDVTNYADYRISFRDLMAFVFQPQNVVANRDILFYRTEKLEHKLKLSRNVLPYVLGAVTPEVLAAQHEEERLKRELRKKIRDLERAQQASSRWEAQMSAHLAKAEELGLHTGSMADNLSPETILQLLRNVASKTVDDFQADSSTITSAVNRHVELEAAEEKQSAELAELKSRLEDMARLKEGVGGYKEALSIQHERLAVSDWLSVQSEKGTSCPICGQGMDEAHSATLNELKRHLAQVEQSSTHIEEMPVAVDREVQHIRQAMDVVVEKLRDIRKQKKTLSTNSKEAAKRQFRSLGVAHFLGQLGQALSLYEEVQTGGELPLEIESLRTQIAELAKQIDHESIGRRLNTALERVSGYVSQFMPQLDNDHASNAARLDVANLTLQISGAEGQSSLWSIGSGSNHLSYHISTLLALHRLFLDAKQSPVPGLLILDQPSQVYFPENIRSGSTQPEPRWQDGDVAAVRKVFELLGSVVERANGRLQVIVLDHAPDSVWGKLSSVALVEDWHTGMKLVPPHWPGAEEG
jgi:hypothetical protein